MTRPVQLLLRFLAIVVFGVVALAVGAMAFFPELGKVKEAASFEPLSKLKLPELPQGSKIVTENGDPYGELVGSENREVVPLNQMSQELQQTVLASEDANFYLHSGVSAKSVIRALRANSDAGGISQGGSTITQQLVKLSLVGSEQSITRKVKEASLAIQLEDQLCDGVPKQQCKDRILEQYLNAVYLGRGAYGMQAASKRYFNKPASEINYAEAAVLAGLIRNPNGADPIRYPEVAKRSRTLVLGRMETEGLLTADEARFIDATPLPSETYGEERGEQTQVLTYVERQIRDELLDAQWLAPTEDLRRYLIFNGGLRITTTINPTAQAQAEAAADANPLKSANPETFVAMTAIEPSNGAVRAVVGEAEVPNKGVVETAEPLPGRSSGSSFKPFTLVAALEAGYGINSPVSGDYAPEGMKRIWGVDQAGPYPDDCPTKGPVLLGKALAESNNCAFMRLQGAVGFDKVRDTAIKLGVRPDGLDPDGVRAACFTIGCDALVGTTDMASAYATIANDGRHNPAHYVTKVEDRSGKVLFEFVPPNEQVISSNVARQATAALQQVVTAGTYAGGSLPQGRPAAGKTGTTELEGGKNTDVWFVGFTPQISAAVWIGNPTANSNMSGGRVQGGVTAARVWQSFMYPYTDDAPVVGFPSPSSVSSTAVPDPWARFAPKTPTTSPNGTSSGSRQSGSSGSSGSTSGGSGSTGSGSTSGGGTSGGGTSGGSTSGGGTGG
ncbi:MAG: transglycosylase domain-containing protein, partial [Microthrixaceae bacterium]